MRPKDAAYCRNAHHGATVGGRCGPELSGRLNQRTVSAAIRHLSEPSKRYRQRRYRTLKPMAAISEMHLSYASSGSRAFFGEVDPVRRQRMRHNKEES